jgi:hypothetical protein
MHTRFFERSPANSRVYWTRELSLNSFHALFLRVITALQESSSGPQNITIVEDWLDHDGLELPRGTKPLAYLFSLAATPRSLFEGTPKDDSVFVRFAGDDGAWILRIRTGWDDEDSYQIGILQLFVADALISYIETALESMINHGDLLRDAKTG